MHNKALDNICRELKQAGNLMGALDPGEAWWELHDGERVHIIFKLGKIRKTTVINDLEMIVHGDLVSMILRDWVDDLISRVRGSDAPCLHEFVFPTYSLSAVQTDGYCTKCGVECRAKITVVTKARTDA